MNDDTPIQNPNDYFEKMADIFYRRTGMMAPGKDEPIGGFGTHTIEQRRSAWEKFIRDYPR